MILEKTTLKSKTTLSNFRVIKRFKLSRTTYFVHKFKFYELKYLQNSLKTSNFSMGKKFCQLIYTYFLNIQKIIRTFSFSECVHSYSCAFDIRGTLEIFLPLKFVRHVVHLNLPKFLKLIVFKLLLHLRCFTVVTLKYWK